MILGMETNSSRMVRLGSAALADREILSPDRILELVDSASVESVHDVVQRYTDPDMMNLCVVGPPL